MKKQLLAGMVSLLTIGALVEPATASRARKSRVEPKQHKLEETREEAAQSLERQGIERDIVDFIPEGKALKRVPELCESLTEQANKQGSAEAKQAVISAFELVREVGRSESGGAGQIHPGLKAFDRAGNDRVEVIEIAVGLAKEASQGTSDQVANVAKAVAALKLSWEERSENSDIVRNAAKKLLAQEGKAQPTEMEVNEKTNALKERKTKDC